MKTKIHSGWVVGYSKGKHELIKNGEVVYENNKILFVGKQYDGKVDHFINAEGQLVSPGFIDTHVHSGHRAMHKLLSDRSRPELFGQPYMEVTIPRKGKTIKGYPNFLTAEEAKQDPNLALHSAFTVTELLRNGVTTFVELGAQSIIQEALWKQCEKLGVRGYLGPGYDSGRWRSDENGNLARVPYPDGGESLFNEALSFIKKVEKDNSDFVHGILVPRELENCSLDILKWTVSASKDLGVPMATHAAYNVIEFYETVRKFGKTPIELLDSIGILQPNLNIGHANIVSDCIDVYPSGGGDIELMGSNGVSISHCPINLVRRARSLQNWDKYHKSGINLTLGSDTYPRDMFMNMRQASYHGKVMSKNLNSATAAEVFTAATLGGARSLGREDIGYLDKGAKADIIIIDLNKNNTLRYGPIYDPIRSIVECGFGDDVSTVITDGQVRMEGGHIKGPDIQLLFKKSQEVGEDIWHNVQDWDRLSRKAKEICPLSFCPDVDRN